MKYVLNQVGKPTINLYQNPTGIMEDYFNLVYKHEVENTDKIYRLVELAFEEKDWASWNFLEWFVQEQIEKETLAMELINKLKIAGGDKATHESLLLLDKEPEQHPNTLRLPEKLRENILNPYTLKT